MDSRTTIGQRLRELRLWRELSQKELGDLVGYSKSYVSMWETGKRLLDRRSQIAALAAVLKVSESELTGGPHLSRDRQQSEPHAAIPAIRVAFATNALGSPAADRVRSLPEVLADVKGLETCHGAGDYIVLGGKLPGLLGELYALASNPQADSGTAARALASVCAWAASMAHNLGYCDLAQLASRAAIEAAKFTGDPVVVGQAEFERIGTAPRAWEHTLAMAERAANALEPHVRDALGIQVLGMLTLRAALAGACVMRADIAEHWLGEAEKLAARVPDDPARNWEWFGTTNVAVWRVALAVERGESGGAVLELAKGVNENKLVVPTRRSALYADVGRGVAREAALRDEAVVWLRKAEDAAPQQFRNHAAARETVINLRDKAIASAGRDLRGMAARMGIPH